MYCHVICHKNHEMPLCFITCLKFGQLIFRKIIRIVATSCQILEVKMYKIRFRLGLRPRPHLRSLQGSPDPVAAFKGPYF